jgi:indole-3-glycerol phosphate synthase
MSPILIAEVKTQSPFGYRSQRTQDELFDLAFSAGDWISIHTDPRWGGSFEWLKEACSRTQKPVLAKGIHEHDSEIVEALACGASSVLVVGRIPEKPLIPRCLIEVTSLEQLAVFVKDPRLIDAKIVWNQRDLQTGEPQGVSEEQVLNLWGRWLCLASMLRNKKDVWGGANAVLVGEHLEEFVSSSV